MLRPSFVLEPANEYLIVIPRLIACFFMHLEVEPDLRNGVSIMKYVVNHPSMIRNAKREDTKEIDIWKVAPAFFLGFAQAVVAIFVEYMIIFYLSSFQSFMDIIMEFTSLSIIISFDDLYASSLVENKMHQAVGKKLRTKFRRSMDKEVYGNN